MQQHNIPKDVDTIAITKSLICAPFPNMERKWTQEEIDELDRVLANYYSD